MNVQNHACIALQQLFPDFLKGHDPKKPLSEREQKTLRFFSDTLATLTSHPAYSYLQKRWNRITQELCKTQEAFSPEFVKRLGKICKKLDELVQDADILCEILTDPVLDTQFHESLKSSLPYQANYIQKAFPKAIEQLQAMVKRVRNGTYGECLSMQVCDLMKSPFLSKDLLLRMLYIDLHLHLPGNADLAKACVWFKDCSEKSNKAIRNYLFDQQTKLSLTGLPPCAVRSILIDKSSNFPKDLQVEFNVMMSKAEFCNNRYDAVIEHLKPYFAPTSMHLLAAARLLVAQGKYEKAMHLVLRLDDKNQMLPILEELCRKSPATADELYLRAKRKWPNFSLGDVLVNIVCEQKREDLSRFECLLGFLARRPLLLNTLEALAKLVSQKSFTDTSLLFLWKVFERKANDVDKINLLENCFKTQFAHLTPSEAITSCKKLCHSSPVEDELPHMLSCLVFISLTNCKEVERCFDLVSELDCSELRLHVCNRIVSHYSSDFTPQHAVEKLQKIKKGFSRPQEALVFLKAEVLLTHKFDEEKAKEQVMRAPDERTQIVLQRLLRSAGRHETESSSSFFHSYLNNIIHSSLFEANFHHRQSIRGSLRVLWPFTDVD